MNFHGASCSSSETCSATDRATDRLLRLEAELASERSLRGALERRVHLLERDLVESHEERAGLATRLERSETRLRMARDFEATLSRLDLNAEVDRYNRSRNLFVSSERGGLDTAVGIHEGQAERPEAVEGDRVPDQDNVDLLERAAELDTESEEKDSPVEDPMQIDGAQSDPADPHASLGAALATGAPPPTPRCCTYHEEGQTTGPKFGTEEERQQNASMLRSLRKRHWRLLPEEEICDEYDPASGTCPQAIAGRCSKVHNRNSNASLEHPVHCRNYLDGGKNRANCSHRCTRVHNANPDVVSGVYNTHARCHDRTI